MLKFLINAYACSSYMGSEPSMARNRLSNLANALPIVCFDTCGHGEVV